MTKHGDKFNNNGATVKLAFGGGHTSVELPRANRIPSVFYDFLISCQDANAKHSFESNVISKIQLQQGEYDLANYVNFSPDALIIESSCPNKQDVKISNLNNVQAQDQSCSCFVFKNVTLSIRKLRCTFLIAENCDIEYLSLQCYKTVVYMDNCNFLPSVYLASIQGVPSLGIIRNCVFDSSSLEIVKCPAAIENCTFKNITSHFYACSASGATIYNSSFSNVQNAVDPVKKVVNCTFKNVGSLLTCSNDKQFRYSFWNCSGNVVLLTQHFPVVLANKFEFYKCDFSCILPPSQHLIFVETNIKWHNPFDSLKSFEKSLVELKCSKIIKFENEATLNQQIDAIRCNNESSSVAAHELIQVHVDEDQTVLLNLINPWHASGLIFIGKNNQKSFIHIKSPQVCALFYNLHVTMTETCSYSYFENCHVIGYIPNENTVSKMKFKNCFISKACLMPFHEQEFYNCEIKELSTAGNFEPCTIIENISINRIGAFGKNMQSLLRVLKSQGLVLPSFIKLLKQELSLSGRGPKLFDFLVMLQLMYPNIILDANEEEMIEIVRCWSHEPSVVPVLYWQFVEHHIVKEGIDKFKKQFAKLIKEAAESKQIYVKENEKAKEVFEHSLVGRMLKLYFLE